MFIILLIIFSIIFVYRIKYMRTMYRCYYLYSARHTSPSLLRDEALRLGRTLQSLSRRSSVEVVVDNVSSAKLYIGSGEGIVSSLFKYSYYSIIADACKIRCRTIYFNNIDRLFQKYNNYIFIIFKKYMNNSMLSKDTVIDVSDYIDINKKIIKMIEKLNNIIKKNKKIEGIVFIDPIEININDIKIIFDKIISSTNNSVIDCVVAVNRAEKEFSRKHISPV